jgi:hypothetical protein
MPRTLTLQIWAVAVVEAALLLMAAPCLRTGWWLDQYRESLLRRVDLEG